MNEKLVADLREDVSTVRQLGHNLAEIPLYVLEELLDTIEEQDKELRYWSNR